MKWNSYTSKNENKPKDHVCYKCGAKDPTVTDAWGHDICAPCYLKVTFKKPKKERRWKNGN